jgi:hypothetical protein
MADKLQQRKEAEGDQKMKEAEKLYFVFEFKTIFLTVLFID